MSAQARRDQLRQRRSEARDRIVAAATEVLRRSSYRDLAVDEVMRVAGLSRTLFYRHFDDLADLLLQVTRSAVEELYEGHRELEQAGIDDPAMVEVALERAVDTFSREGPLIRALAEAATQDAALDSAYDDVRQRYVALTERYLRRLREHGATRVADPAETALALTLLNERYLLHTFGGAARTSPEVALHTLTEIWTSTIAG